MIALDEHVELEITDGREVAYVITDACFPFPLRIAKSSNAWWTDNGKVDRLIEAFKQGHLVRDALFYAGITRHQWEYFIEVHPDFSEIKEACEAQPTFTAMKSVNSAMVKDGNLAFKYLSKIHPKFNAPAVEAPALSSPTVNIAIGANIDAGFISSTIRDIAREVFGTRRSETEAQDRLDSNLAGGTEERP